MHTLQGDSEKVAIVPSNFSSVANFTLLSPTSKSNNIVIGAAARLIY